VQKFATSILRHFGHEESDLAFPSGGFCSNLNAATAFFVLVGFLATCFTIKDAGTLMAFLALASYTVRLCGEHVKYQKWKRDYYLSFKVKGVSPFAVEKVHTCERIKAKYLTILLIVFFISAIVFASIVHWGKFADASIMLDLIVKFLTVFLLVISMLYEILSVIEALFIAESPRFQYRNASSGHSIF